MTMKINEKRMTFVRKFLGGPFNHEKHFEEMEKKLLYVQEREWKSPFKTEHKIDSNYINILRDDTKPSLENDGEVLNLTRNYEGEVLKGT
jgi:hypothetical protein